MGEAKSGAVCLKLRKEEFQALIKSLLGATDDPSDVPAPRMERFWTDIDANGDKEVSFQEFLPWFNRYFNDGPFCAASNVYRKLGEDRICSFLEAEKQREQSQKKREEKTLVHMEHKIQFEFLSELRSGAKCDDRLKEMN